jgi:hypothetical protein
LHPSERLAPLAEAFPEGAVIRMPDLDAEVNEPVGENLLQGSDFVVGQFDVQGHLRGRL